MGKAIIKSIGAPSTGTASTSLTVTTANGSATSVVPGPIITPGPEMTGTLEEIVNNNPTGKLYDFRQPLGYEMGLDVNDKVTFIPVTDPADNTQVAVSLRQVDRGVIQSVDASGESGTLLDRTTKSVINFRQPLASAMGIKAPGAASKGSVVSFERAIDPITAIFVAVSLELIK